MDAAQPLKVLISQSVLPASEARILMAYILDKHHQLPRSALISRDDMVLSEAAQQEWKALVSRRMQGEPIAYIVGKKGFHNIELIVGPGVLIPRPETELLVDLALDEISNRLEHNPLTETFQVLDLGTGSGAIALAIANASPKTILIATDQSEDALSIARQNAQWLGLESRVRFFHGSWYQALREAVQFDVIVSNPPYIANQNPHLTQGDLRFEPTSALTDYSDGLTHLEVIISQADHHLKPGGFIAVEHGFDQSEAVVSLMKAAGLKDIHVHTDLAGHIRAASGRKSAVVHLDKGN